MGLADDSWRRVRALFDRAVDLPPEDRAALLRSESAEVRGEVERLIAADSSASGLFERGIRSGPVEDAAWEATLAPGQAVGPFRLVRAIGSGGMGLVFEAEETSPGRRVALKTVRAEFFTPELLRRFANEVQLLARLEHPGIARIYASGTFERAGVECPYYTMELVEEARTVLRFAEERALDVRARIELFLQACDAVEHGHRKGVIHRDLKPGNLLVDARGRLKVIDFGLARPEDPAAFGADPLRTRAGLVFGTLAYMSPEHVSGRPLEIDTRSDVHSLGCILCELVAGRPPHELYDVPIRTALERIEEADPDLPASLPRELAWIVRRAIERDPARRYPTAGGLAADLRRFLEGRPVEAAPPSRRYALASFARRHKGLLAAGLAVVVALSVGLGREARAREAAELEAELAAEVGGFLEDVFVQANVFELGADVTVRDAVARASERVDEVERGDVRAVLHGLVGQAFLNLGEHDAAERHLAEAVRLGEEHLAPDDRHRLRAEIVWADLLERTGRYAESRELSLRTIPAAEGILPGDDVFYASYNLAVCESRLGNEPAAEAIYRRLYREQVERGGSASVLVNLRHRIGQSLANQERYDEARPVFEEALADSRSTPGQEAYAAILLSELGTLELALGNLDRAEEILRAVEDEFERTGQSEHNRASAALDLADLLLEKGELSGCAEAVRRAEGLAASVPGETTLEVRVLLTEARLYAAEGRSSEAAATAEEALALAEHLTGPDGTATVVAREVLGDVSGREGD